MLTMFPNGLTEMFPNGNGMNVLSETALPKSGISVEISKVNRSVLKAWWDQTQSGTLIEIVDVRAVQWYINGGFYLY